MRRWIFSFGSLIGALILAIGIQSTGRAQSFSARMYVPSIRLDNPCAATAMPLITRPPTHERIAVVHSGYQSQDTPDLYFGNADDTGRTRLTNDGAIEGRPTWSPDGTRIAYVSGAGQTIELKVLQLSNHQARSIFTLTAGASMAEPAWSPDGKQIAFTFYPFFYSGSNIAIIQADGTNLRNLTSAGTDTSPSWSPDSSRIVFASLRSGTNHLYVMHADGTNQTQITNEPTWDFEPAWSPDGSRIAFRSTCALSRLDSIFTIQADGSGRTHIPIPPVVSAGEYNSQTQPSWSPDGTRIAFTQGFFKSTAIYIINLDGSGYSVFGLPLDSSASWAPR